MKPREYQFNGEEARLYSYVSNIAREPEDENLGVVCRWTVPIMTDALYSLYGEAVKIDYQTENGLFNKAGLLLHESEGHTLSHIIHGLQTIIGSDITKVQPELDPSVMVKK